MYEYPVLVVDDEEPILDSVMTMLAEEEIDCQGASSRVTAREKLHSRFFPVIVTDIRLHSEEEGLQLLDEIRLLAPESRVICMSGHLTDDLVADVRRRGARFVVAKAAAPATLISAVQELLGEMEKVAATSEPLDLEQLYASTHALMHSIPMRRYGLSPEQAEDVVQEAWLLFLERRGIVRYARGWLAGAVAKLSLRHKYRMRREVVDDELLEGTIDERTTVWTDVMSVRTALEQIDVTSRTLCTLIGMEGHSYGEVSEKTGYALGAIGPLYIRAKNRLKKALGH